MTNRTALFSRKQSGGMFSIEDQSIGTGARFFVHSGSGVNGAGYGRNPDSPVATIDYAVGLCTASKGDKIFVMEGHAETITGATGCVLDVAGVEVIGLGRGAMRPTLTLSTAAGATLSITAASCRVANIKLLQAFATGVTAGITLAASADGAVLEDIVMAETANTEEYLIGISIAAACADVTIDRLRYFGTAGGTTSSAITCAGAAHGLRIRDSYINVDASGSIIDALTAASTDIEIYDNRLINVETGAGLGISAHSSTTGMVARNLITNLRNAVAGVAGAGLSAHENYGSNAVGAQGTVALALAVDT